WQVRRERKDEDGRCLRHRTDSCFLEQQVRLAPRRYPAAIDQTSAKETTGRCLNHEYTKLVNRVRLYGKLQLRLRLHLQFQRHSNGRPLRSLGRIPRSERQVRHCFVGWLGL